MSARLTQLERNERATLEANLERAVVDLAAIHGWEWLHVRPGMRANGRWWTATTGTLAAWPDLVLVRVRDRRLIFAELKRELEHPTQPQLDVLATLGHLSVAGDGGDAIRRQAGVLFPAIECHVWRPSDLRDPIDESTIGRILR